MQNWFTCRVWMMRPQDKKILAKHPHIQSIMQDILASLAKMMAFVIWTNISLNPTSRFYGAVMVEALMQPA